MPTERSTRRSGRSSRPKDSLAAQPVQKPQRQGPSMRMPPGRRMLVGAALTVIAVLLAASVWTLTRSSGSQHQAVKPRASKPVSAAGASKTKQHAAADSTATAKAKTAAQPIPAVKAKKRPVKAAANTVSYVRLFPVHTGCGGIAFRPKPKYTGGHYLFKQGVAVRLTPKPCDGWKFARWTAPANGKAAVRCKHRVCRFAIQRVRKATAVFVKMPVVHNSAPPAQVVVTASQPAAPSTPVYVAPATRTAPSAPSPDPAPKVTSSRLKPDAYPVKAKKKTTQKPAVVDLPPPPPIP